MSVTKTGEAATEKRYRAHITNYEIEVWREEPLVTYCLLSCCYAWEHRADPARWSCVSCERTLGVLYEYKTVEVLSPRAPQTMPSSGVAPYYLQSAWRHAEPQKHVLEEVMRQAVAEGWEFCQIEKIGVKQHTAYPYCLSDDEASDIAYTLSFRRAKQSYR